MRTDPVVTRPVVGRPAGRPSVIRTSGRSRRAARTRRSLPPGWRSVSFTVVALLAWLYGVGVPLVQTLTATKVQEAAGQNTTGLSGLATLVSHMTPLIIIGACLATVVLVATEGFPVNGAARLAVLVAPWLWLVFRDERIGTSPHLKVLVYPLICVTVWALRPPLSRLALIGWITGGTALLALALGLLMPHKGLYQSATGLEISPDKQILSGILVGPFASGNNLGQFLAMGTPTVFMIGRKRWRWVMFAACIYAQLWAASRSCLIALIVILVLAILLRFSTARTGAGIAGVTLVALTAAVAWLPFSTSDESAYSNRGYVWDVARNAWHANPMEGLGSTFFARIATTSSTLGGSVYHAHNQFLQALVTGGWILGLLLGLVMAVAVPAAVRWVRAGHTVPALYLAGLLGACLLEVSYVLVDRYFVLPVMVVPLAMLLFADESEPGVRPGAEPGAEPGADPGVDAVSQRARARTRRSARRSKRRAAHPATSGLTTHG